MWLGETVSDGKISVAPKLFLSAPFPKTGFWQHLPQLAAWRRLWVQTLGFQLFMWAHTFSQEQNQLGVVIWIRTGILSWSKAADWMCQRGCLLMPGFSAKMKGGLYVDLSSAFNWSNCFLNFMIGFKHITPKLATIGEKMKRSKLKWKCSWQSLQMSVTQKGISLWASPSEAHEAKEKFPPTETCKLRVPPKLISWLSIKVFNTKQGFFNVLSQNVCMFSVVKRFISEEKRISSSHWLRSLSCVLPTQQVQLCLFLTEHQKLFCDVPESSDHKSVTQALEIWQHLCLMLH